MNPLPEDFYWAIEEVKRLETWWPILEETTLLYSVNLGNVVRNDRYLVGWRIYPHVALFARYSALYPHLYVPVQRILFPLQEHVGVQRHDPTS